MNRRERRIAAKGSQTGSKESGPDTPAALYEAGLRHLRAQQYLDAQICCQQALAADANHADTLHLMGLLSFQAKQYDHAVEWISRAIRQTPKPEYLSNLGTALQQQGRLEEALKVFDKAVQLEPDNAELWMKLGSALADLNRPDQALLSFQHVLKLNPRHWNAADKSASLLFKLGQLEPAISYFDLCDQVQPNHAPTLQRRALAMHGLDRFEEGLADLRCAHALDPANADMCNDIGVILQQLGREEQALLWFDLALELRPDYPLASTNKALSLTKLHRFSEAFALYDEIKVSHPDDATANWNSSHLHLLVGNFEAGWSGREARWKDASLASTYPKLFEPIWLGELPLQGKTILIHFDEGLGDTIQFARYIPMLAERGARVVLVVQDTLHLLLSDMPGASQCLPKSATTTLPAFDFHCPIMSLPLAFGTRLDTIPAPTSYLPRPPRARVEAWEDRLGPHDRLRVGLVWSGNPRHKNDRDRSIPLQMFARILDVDATFVSLQKSPRPADNAILQRTDIIDLTADLTDFVETAALVSCLDLVITVDTSVAHLAGALGHPTWLLLPYLPDYRWLLDRDDSPWYPMVRLFRQTETRDYETVLDRVRSELLALISAG